MGELLVKRILISASCAVIAIVFVALAWHVTRPKAPPTPAYTGPIEKIRVANIGIFTIYNLIAEEQGYFEKYGLDAEITEYDSGATSMAALLADEADVAIAADFVGVTNLSKNADIRILARVSDHDVFRLIARKDKGIALPADLNGKTIGVTRKTAGEFYLGRFLTNVGLDIAEVTLVDLPPGPMVEQLEQGALDAILIFEPHAYAAEQALGEQALVWSAQGNQQAFGLVYAMRPYVERHPEVVERYLRALADAERYVEEHEAEAQSFLKERLSYEDAYMEHIWGKFTFAIGLDKDMVLSMEEQTRWLIRNGLTEQTSVPNYLEEIYFTGLEQVKPESVTIVH